MRLGVFLIIFSALGYAWGQIEFVANPAEQLYGNWQFYRHIYQGVEGPLPNPQLVLQYEFLEDGHNRLYWSRRNENGFCERRAEFLYDGEYIEQEVVWVNPENVSECGADTDMQIGQINRTRLTRSGEYLHLHIPLAGDEFIYVFRRIR